jgi:hypothetical protein
MKKGVFIMPGGDRRGPMGSGPRTGRAVGYCSGYPVPGYLNPIPGRGYLGRGRGFWGRGGGRGWRHWYYATGIPGWARTSMGVPFSEGWIDPVLNPYAADITPKQETEMLKKEADLLKKELEDTQSRIKTLEKVQAQEKEK